MTDQELLDRLEDLQVRALQAAELMGGASRGDPLFLDAGELSRDSARRDAWWFLLTGTLVIAASMTFALIVLAV